MTDHSDSKEKLPVGSTAGDIELGSYDNKTNKQQGPVVDQPRTSNAGHRSRSDVNAFDQRSDERLTHALLPRHLAMISVGGVIGTGLFLGTGSALHNGGPLSLFMAYCLVGSVCYSVMMCLGEMISYLPVPGGHVKLAERFVGRPLSFAMGWLYVFNWLITMPTELVAASILVSFWSDLSPAIFIVVFGIVAIGINLLGTRAYGEAEFWFASIKVITIVGLILLSICIDLGAGDQGRLGFRYWRNPGVFAQFKDIPGAKGRFLGMFSCLVQAGFSFIGTEIVAIAAGEAANPRRSIPSAIKKVWLRIVFFYLMGTFCIGLICPYNAPELTKGSKTNRSPFVIAIKLAGIKALPSIINVCLITSAVSAASSDLYTSSRGLYGLALAGNAPRIFARTTKKGLPWVAVLTGILVSLLAFMSLGSGASTVFGWMVNMLSVCGLSSWFFLAIMYTRFYRGLKVQGLQREKLLPFYSKNAPVFAVWVIFWSSIIIFFSGWDIFLKASRPFDKALFLTTYFPIVLAPALFFGSWWFYGRDSIITPDQIDFHTGVKEIEEAEYEPAPPRNAWEKFWQWVA
ncbi:unnamed protein product [Sympodiomycopsis kandeliae]